MTRIAIVGASDKHWRTTEQRSKAISKIGWVFTTHFKEGDTLISGGCPFGGVDNWAANYASVHNLKKEIFYPEVYTWLDKNYKMGFRSRNKLIAENCDVLFCIEPKGRKHSGGMWTLSCAKSLNKEVHLIEID